jgi:hypothetical protein
VGKKIYITAWRAKSFRGIKKNNELGLKETCFILGQDGDALDVYR